MKKPKKAKIANRDKGGTQEFVASFYGTKPEWVKSDPKEVTVNGETYTDVVEAEDENGIYFTRLCWATGNLLDPYRLYQRTKLE